MWMKKKANTHFTLSRSFSLWLFEAPFPNPSPERWREFEHSEVQDAQKIQEAKNGKCFQPFEHIEPIEPFEPFIDTKAQSHEDFFIKQRC